MGVIFRWFKEFEIQKTEYAMWTYSYYQCYFKCIGNWGCTTHSYGSRSKLQDLFEIVGCRIPTIPEIIPDEELEKYVHKILVNPSEMSKKCQELLCSNLDLHDLKERIKKIKELSDKGYYIAYDML